MLKGTDIDHIPPTEDALRQHSKRTVFQAGHCSGKCLEVYIIITSFSKRMRLGKKTFSRM